MAESRASVRTPTAASAPGISAPSSPGLGRALALAGVVLWLASFVVLAVASPEGLRQSTDPGSASTPLWVIVLPVAAAIPLIRMLPRTTPALPPLVADRRMVRRSTAALLACALVFTLLVRVTEASATGWYLVAKVVVLITVPAVLVWRSRSAISIPGATQPWQWWPPIVVVAVWTWLSQAAPWIQEPSFDGVDVVFLVVVASLTALTAGVGEELFFRRWLQSRLESQFGRWGGIALASLAFALMHLSSDRQESSPVVEIAAVIVVQGSFGAMLGYLWSKYRNLWVVIAAHLVVNGYAVVGYLVAG